MFLTVIFVTVLYSLEAITLIHLTDLEIRLLIVFCSLAKCFPTLRVGTPTPRGPRINLWGHKMIKQIRKKII